MLFLVRSNDGAVTTAYFTHSGTILKLIALLGLAKDPHPLMHDSLVLRKKEDKRAWRSSIIDTFASNMAFVLYEYVPFLKSQNYIVYIVYEII